MTDNASTDAGRAVANLAAQGGRTLVLHGAGTAGTARGMLPALPAECFVPVDGGASLRAAAEHGLAQVILIGTADEVAAAGTVTGEATGAVTGQEAGGGEPVTLAAITTDMDGGPALAAEVAEAGTARRAYELWEAAGMLGPCGRELCRRTAGALERTAARTVGQDTSPIAAQVVLVDFAGERMVGMYGRLAR